MIFAKNIIFDKIINGELDYHLLRVIIPYADYLTSLIEAAVVYGVLDEGALVVLRENRRFA